MLIYNTLPYKFPFIRCILSDKAHIRLYGKYMMIVVHHNTDYIIGIHRGPQLIASFVHYNSYVSTRLYIPTNYNPYSTPPKWSSDEVYGFEYIDHFIPIIDKTKYLDLKYNILGFILECGRCEHATHKISVEVII